MFCFARQNQVRAWSKWLVPVLCSLLMSGRATLLLAEEIQNTTTQVITHEVIMQKMRFIPEQLIIHEGDTVRWVNREKRQYHNVWFEALGEQEPDYLFPEETYQRTFYQQGEYPYRCGPHPLMLGTITVLPRKNIEEIPLSSAASNEVGVDQKRQQELHYLLKQDCGSCHGMRLLGGLGPALLPENLASASIEDLTAVILEGRPGTAMPPWKALLSTADARWLSQQLKSGAALE